MPEVNSPASSSPSQMAGMQPPPQQGGDLGTSVPGAGSPDQSATGGSPGGGSSADAKLKQDIQALRAMEASLLEMGQSYPNATKALRTASESIRSAQRQIVSSPGLAEQPVPNTTA